MTDKAMPIPREAWEAFRSAFRALGPCHRNVDRWRYELGWKIDEPVIANYLAVERSKLINKAAHA